MDRLIERVLIPSLFRIRVKSAKQKSVNHPEYTVHFINQKIYKSLYKSCKPLDEFMQKATI
jgi:hypothetical protein